MKILRTLLFTPGNCPRMIEKSSTLAADAVILDLEDSVPLEEKESARIAVRDSVHVVKKSGHNVFVRINSLSTDLAEDDLKLCIMGGLDGVVLPKAEEGKDVLILERLLEKMEKAKRVRRGKISVIPIIESAKGVVKAYEIARSSPRIIAVGFGALDFTRDMGSSLTKQGDEFAYARSLIAIVARAYGILAVDTPWLFFTDLRGLIRDAQLARQLGYKGKFVIHPNQIEPVNRVFSPSGHEIACAKKIVTEFERNMKMGLGAISLNGKMIDIANYRHAKSLLSSSEVLAARERRK